MDRETKECNKKVQRNNCTTSVFQEGSYNDKQEARRTLGSSYLAGNDANAEEDESDRRI